MSSERGQRIHEDVDYGVLPDGTWSGWMIAAALWFPAIVVTIVAAEGFTWLTGITFPFWVGLLAFALLFVGLYLFARRWRGNGRPRFPPGVPPNNSGLPS